jgi:FAD/FMN-containing dehydrogenase
MESESVTSSSPISLDDVSRLSKTSVSRVMMPLNDDDVLACLEFAWENQVAVAARGTKHSMGGHSLSGDGIAIDMCRLNRVTFDVATQLCTAEAGALWSDVIQVLNVHGRSPKTLQSYASFSVGGSVSVNAHGITSDYSLGESLVSLKILRLDKDGKRQTVIAERGSELFRLAIGGYGLAGVKELPFFSRNCFCFFFFF